MQIKGRHIFAGVASLALAGTLVAMSQGGADAKSDASTFSRNAQGVSYGSAAKADSPADEPDLILVVATNGREGYVYKSDLDKAAGAHVASPTEALAWQKANEGKNVTLPVFEADGRTKVGVFSLHHPTEAERAAAAADAPRP